MRCLRVRVAAAGGKGAPPAGARDAAEAAGAGQGPAEAAAGCCIGGGRARGNDKRLGPASVAGRANDRRPGAYEGAALGPKRLEALDPLPSLGDGMVRRVVAASIASSTLDATWKTTCRAARERSRRETISGGRTREAATRPAPMSAARLPSQSSMENPLSATSSSGMCEWIHVTTRSVRRTCLHRSPLAPSSQDCGIGPDFRRVKRLCRYSKSVLTVKSPVQCVSQTRADSSARPMVCLPETRCWARVHRPPVPGPATDQPALLSRGSVGWRQLPSVWALPVMC